MTLDGLQVLDLGENRIEVLPKQVVAELEQLVTLDLSHNLVRALPDEISSLRCEQQHA